jgi:hypothetical protein
MMWPSAYAISTGASGDPTNDQADRHGWQCVPGGAPVALLDQTRGSDRFSGSRSHD